jgi:50S ribosomal protein L16 3-hydroxylase
VISPQFDLDAQLFLTEYWQKKPLLIRQAIPNFQSPISPEELAGLAMEAEADSRIVSQRDDQWLLEIGPFTEGDFQRDDQWSLLVQRVDEWLPEVAALRGCVDFLPTWRFDDVMVSYAVDRAGVGPHFDQYDVFLLQGAGNRRWRIGAPCDASTALIDTNGLKLIEPFDVEAEFELEPGDVLYVPPRVPHWGTAIGESMTYSLGFRAPRLSDLIARLSDSAIASVQDSLLLEDWDSTRVQVRAGEMTERHKRNAFTAVVNALAHLTDDDWLPELLSETPWEPTPNDGHMSKTIILAPSQRLIWQAHDDHITAHLGGGKYEMDLTDESLLIALCSGRTCGTGDLSESTLDHLRQWWTLGLIEEPELGPSH